MLGRQIAVNGAIYVGFEVINKSIPFILIAYFSSLLGAEEIGHFAEFMATIGLFGVLTGLSAHGAVSVTYFKINADIFPEYVFNILVLLFLSSSFVLILIFLFEKVIIQWAGIPVHFLYLAALGSVGLFITQVNLIIWQVKKQAFKYGLYQSLLSITYGGSAFVLVNYVDQDWQSIANAYIYTYIIFGVISILVLYFRGYIKLKLSYTHLKDAASFGVPLMPHVLAGWFFLGYNIFLIKATLGSSKAGVFNMAMQFSLVMNVIALALNKAYSPIAYGLIKENTDSSKNKLKLLTLSGFALTIILGAIVGTIGYVGITRFMSLDFLESSEILPVLICNSVINAAYLLVAVFLFYEKKTSSIAIVTFLSATLHVILSNILIQEYELWGIVYSLVFVSAIKLILIWMLAHKVYPLNWYRSND